MPHSNTLMDELATKSHKELTVIFFNLSLRYPDQRIENGVLNYIDLTIYHPKYAQKYADHVAIDLPHFACTMSQANFPHVAHLWKYVVAQPLANKIGPLGRRAGIYGLIMILLIYLFACVYVGRQFGRFGFVLVS